MTLKTSSCKGSALKKDLSRFWPVWVGYTLALGLIQVIISGDGLDYWYAVNMADLLCAMGLVNLIFALVSAQMLFGDLFSSRLCSGIHCLPLKRQDWFSAHLQAGFFFSLVPTALITLFSEGVILLHSNMVDGWQIPLYWFLGSNLQYMFFFGLAVFCAMCAGNRLGMAMVYGIANSFSLLVYLLVDQLYVPLLHGVTTMSGPFELLCPVFHITNTRCLATERMETGRTYLDIHGIEQREFIGTFSLKPEGWMYIGILALIGIVLLLAARGIYKKRHLECAGDFLALRWLEWPFQVIFTVLCAAGFHAFFLLFFGFDSSYVYILQGIGLLGGWFAGRMLLERSTRVFRLKNIAGFLLVAAAMAGSLYLTHLDPLGIEVWIPRPEDVKSASLRMNYRNGYVTEDPQEIRDLMRLHQLALEQKLEPHPDYSDTYYSPYAEENDCAYAILQYTAPNGWLSQRNYYVLAEGESGELMKKYCSRLEVLFHHQDVKDPEDLKHQMKDMDRIIVHGQILKGDILTEEFLEALAQAIAADAAAGSLIQSGAFHQEPVLETSTGEHLYYLNLEMENLEKNNFFGSISVYADCEHTMKLLESTGVLDAIRTEVEESYYG